RDFHVTGVQTCALPILDNVFDIVWVDGVTYGDVYHQNEVEQSRYNFEAADTSLLFQLFESHEREAGRLVAEGLVLPAYDQVLKCSHVFNLLDARGAISVTERTKYIARVRHLARQAAERYVVQRERMGFPMLRKRQKVARR